MSDPRLLGSPDRRRMPRRKDPGFVLLLGGALALLGSGCELRKEMYDQAKIEPLEASSFFEDGRGSRLPVTGTVPVGHLRADDHRYRGQDADGQYTAGFPAGIAVTEEFVARGRDRYQIYCSVCHGYSGHGDGMVVQRGFKQPTSYHDPRLLGEADGYLFHVISNGYGVMNGYAHAIPVEDRWAIVAYVRALQISQNARLEDVPPASRGQLDMRGAPASAPAARGGHGS